QSAVVTDLIGNARKETIPDGFGHFPFPGKHVVVVYGAVLFLGIVAQSEEIRAVVVEKTRMVDIVPSAFAEIIYRQARLQLAVEAIGHRRRDRRRTEETRRCGQSIVFGREYEAHSKAQ